MCAAFQQGGWKILPRGNVRWITTRAEKSLYCAVDNNPGPCRANCAQTNNPRQDAPQKNGFLRIVRRITTALPRKKRIVPWITIPAVRCTVDFFRNVPSITTAAKILQFGNCAPDNNPTAGNVRWITTRSGHVWKADEIPKCAADNNSRFLPTAQIVLWITTQHFLCLLWWIRGESGGKP